MARRAWTAEDVLEAVLEDEDFDDPNEPMLEGSDDVFSDLEMEEDEDDELASSLCSSISSVLSSPATSTLPISWSSSLKQVNIREFTSPVGPTVDIPASPLEAFEVFFTTDL